MHERHVPGCVLPLPSPCSHFAPLTLLTRRSTLSAEYHHHKHAHNTHQQQSIADCRVAEHPSADQDDDEDDVLEEQEDDGEQEEQDEQVMRHTVCSERWCRKALTALCRRHGKCVVFVLTKCTAVSVCSCVPSKHTKTGQQPWQEAQAKAQAQAHSSRHLCR